MASLPDRPDMAQLRRQAKELYRSAAGGDPEGIRRLRAVARHNTLNAAQLALAREHGFRNWPQLCAAVETARHTGPSPLMADKHRGTAVYGADDVLSWAHAEGWRPGARPIGAVFTSQTFITSYLTGRNDRYRPSDTLTPINGRVFLTPSPPTVAIACPGVGAPAVVTLLEHLVGLGVGCFVAVGPAPAVATDLAWGDCVVIDRALRDDGVSGHYLPPARHAMPDAALTRALLSGAMAKGLHPMLGSAWTLPTPFRTTDEELTAYRSEGVLVTDMVTAALFAVAAALGVRAASAVIATRAVDARRATATPEAGVPQRGGQVTKLLETAVSVLQATEVAA